MDEASFGGGVAEYVTREVGESFAAGEATSPGTGKILAAGGEALGSRLSLSREKVTSSCRRSS